MLQKSLGMMEAHSLARYHVVKDGGCFDKACFGRTLKFAIVEEYFVVSPSSYGSSRYVHSRLQLGEGAIHLRISLIICWRA